MTKLKEWWNNHQSELNIIGYFGNGLVFLFNLILWVSNQKDPPSPNKVIEFLQQVEVPKFFTIICNIILSAFIIQFIWKRFNRHPSIYNRFDDITEIKYGYIPYPPLLHRAKNEIITGIGERLLAELFSVDNEKKIPVKAKKEIKWNEIEKALYWKSGRNYVIDIIATPLFETSERSKKVLFCSPIFFSEVGIYVKKDDHEESVYKKLKLDLETRKNLNYKAAIDAIKELDIDLTIVCVEGEISEKMVKDVKRNRDSAKYVNMGKDAKDITDLINRLVEDKDGATHIVFTERYQAEESKYVNKEDSDKVVNILTDQAIYYPVSFAVRKEEYVLRNYINHKLLSLSRDCVINHIIEELKSKEEYRKHRHPLVNTLYDSDKTPEEKVKEVESYFLPKKVSCKALNLPQENSSATNTPLDEGTSGQGARKG